MIHISSPINLKQVRSFLGTVTYYRDVLRRRSHVLGPLRVLIGTVPFVWFPLHQQAFEEMKALLVADTLIRYPDHIFPFHIFTDASDYQLGPVIIQNDHPSWLLFSQLICCSEKLYHYRKRITFVVETFKEFRSMLLGAVLHVHTDHCNLIYSYFSTNYA